MSAPASPACSPRMTAGAWPMFRRRAVGAESDERRTSPSTTPASRLWHDYVISGAATAGAATGNGDGLDHLQVIGVRHGERVLGQRHRCQPPARLLGQRQRPGRHRGSGPGINVTGNTALSGSANAGAAASSSGSGIVHRHTFSGRRRAATTGNGTE